jgi:hypothetical protein
MVINDEDRYGTMRDGERRVATMGHDDYKTITGQNRFLTVPVCHLHH